MALSIATKMLALVLSIVVILTFSHIHAKQKPVTVTLDARWNSTPMLLEASEYIASESKENFWLFIDEVSKLTPEQIKSETDQSLYHLIQKYAAKFLSQLQLQMMKISLSLRSFSPAIQNYVQMASEEKRSDDCFPFAVAHGDRICDHKAVEKILETVKDRPKSQVYKFDHVYPGSENGEYVVILYAELGKLGFREFHETLSKLAKDGKITYVLRSSFEGGAAKKARLSGYGVELAIKSTEYKAKDDTKIEGGGDGEQSDVDLEEDVAGFSFSVLKDLHPDKTTELKQFYTHLVGSSNELAALKVWQLQDLSFQAAQKVLSAPSDKQLELLRDVSQNFPSLARSLVKVAVDGKLKKEVAKNQQYFESYLGIGSGESAMFLNGLNVDLEVYDIFTLLDLIKSEAKLMEGLFSLGFKGKDLNQMIRLDLGGDSKDFALDIRHTAVQFLNDLENDRKYKGWPNSVQDMLRPTFPGMLRHVAKNIFHLVFIVDPLDATSVELIKMAEAFLVHSAPIRLGIVFKVNFDKDANAKEDAGVAMVRAYDNIRQEEDPGKALSFITDVYARYKTNEITAEKVMKMFGKKFKDQDEEAVFGDNTEYDFLRRGAADYIQKSGLSEFPQVLLNGVPLKQKFLTGDTFEEGVVSEIMTQTPEIQKAIYQGTLHDYVNILEWLMERDNVLPRLNSRVLSPPKQTLDFTASTDDDLEKDTFVTKTSAEMTSIMAKSMKYLSRKDEETLVPITMWVVCDLETPEGRDLLYSAIKSLKHSYDMRLGVVFNSGSQPDSDNMISKAVYTALHTLGNNHAKSFITKLVKEENVADLKASIKTLQDLEVHGMDMKAYMSAFEKQSTDFLDVHRAFVTTVLGWGSSGRGIIANGKVYGPLGETEQFLQEDVDLVEKVVYQAGSKKIKEEAIKMGLEGNKGSDMIMKVSALLSSTSSSSDRKEIQFGGDQNSVLKIEGSPDSPAYQVDVVVDPVSSEAQKIAPILLTLKQIVNINIRIFMNCKEKISEMPLKTYYRYVLEPELTFRPDGSLTSGPFARFTDLPQKSVLTLGVQTPESWLVESVKAPYDLDNLLLEEVEKGVTAEFDLEYLLLEGHCSDATSGQPPRGLQFTLGTNSTGALVDTIVMANLGYFQLKANPGLWNLKLREGRSKDIYNIASHDYTDTPEGSKDVVVSVNSFKSKIIRIKVEKKKDKLQESLLKDDDDDDKSLWDSISSSFAGEKKSDEDEDKTLNIFSLASGHMYERLMRIMMLSVVKQTKSKVKFWFLKNYLSPSHKDFIPLMAKEYGFEYEFVQYKWPRWLNAQKEKQRVMWGYKILFLDVLFPLDVKKIIFVDADQVVRTDLQELHDLDLEGAPYGYTPFCDSRTEMDGFRFWRSGYWASHLAGRKYHISALYVVDLKKFRRIAAGDRLRGQYQGLSQDPNSLSNLDQDLPNNMIHQVAIKSLPQEWLWCETWCDDESKKKAKTIDLCNNPQTKEPKLKAALRILPEWREYDYEVKVLWDKVYKTNTRLQTEYEVPDIDEEKIGSKLHLHDEL